MNIIIEMIARPSISHRSIITNVQPGKGTISFRCDTKKERKEKQDEFKEANRLLRDYGGDYIILKESKTQGISTPDIMRNGRELFELKRPSTTTAIDSRLKSGIEQMLYENNHFAPDKPRILVLVLGPKLRSMSDRRIKDIINKRLSLVSRNELNMIIIRNGNKSFIITI